MTVFQKMNSTVQGTWNDLYEANDPPNQQNLWDFDSELDPRIINDHNNVPSLFVF